MAKNKKKKRKDREKRQQQKRRRGPGRTQVRRERGERVAARASAESLDGLKRAPPPEILPALVLAVGATLPVLSVRWYPSWPAWGHALVWLACAGMFTFAARRVAKRRPPKWDPWLFFGVSALAATVGWSGDAGELWAVNSGREAVSWRVDGGLETQLEPGARARIDLRRGPHQLRSEDQIVDFTLERGERIVVPVGPTACASVGGDERREGLFRLGAAAPDPVACSSRPASGSGEAGPPNRDDGASPARLEDAAVPAGTGLGEEAGAP